MPTAPSMAQVPAPSPAIRAIDWVVSIPFFSMHAGAVVGLFIVGLSWRSSVLAS